MKETERPSYTDLCNEAQSLWRKISEIAEAQLREFVEDESYEILIGIAKSKNPDWENAGMVPLANLVFHMSEAVVLLDILRLKEANT